MNKRTDTYFVSQRFYFEAAHTLNRAYEVEGSRRIHGHTYEAEVTVHGIPDPETGMLVDIAILRNAIEQIKLCLDHQFLDEIPELGIPTLENLCLYIKRKLELIFPNISNVMVERRVSGDRCVLHC